MIERQVKYRSLDELCEIMLLRRTSLNSLLVRKLVTDPEAVDVLAHTLTELLVLVETIHQHHKEN